MYLNQLKDYLCKYENFDEEEIQVIYANCDVENYKDKQHLLEQEQVCEYNFFILKGLVRKYAIDDSGQEKVQGFGIENWWVTSLESFVEQKPSRQAIQCLEQTVVLRISFEDLEELYHNVPKLNSAFRKIYLNMLIAIQKRDELYMRTKRETRYQTLLDNIPQIFQRVPLYMIASYLDITPEYLSTIRKNQKLRS